MKNLFTLVILLCPALYGWADEENTVKKTTDAHITGHIILKETGEHLPFMTILLKGTNIGTATDETGHFFLKNLPEGKYTLRVQGVGYKSAEKEIVIVKGKTQEVNFEISEDAVLLDGAVVTANRNETDRREAPVIVNVLSPKVFENTNSVCLSQGLNFQPGLRVENNCQNCGFQQVRINGLDGPYSQILIDSRPMCSSLAGVYGLEQIPANMIERVEVVRRGGSALFGASAIGGTINIITKEPTRNSAELAHSLMSIGGSCSFENNTTLNASLVTEDNKAGFYVYGQNRYRSGYDNDGDGYTELPNLRNQTIGVRSFLRLNPYSKLTLQYHGINEFRRGGNLLKLPAHEANIAEQIEHNINGGDLSYDYFSPDEKNHLNVYFSFQNTARKSYYGGTGEGITEEDKENAEKAYGTTSDLTLVGGALFRQATLHAV